MPSVQNPPIEEIYTFSDQLALETRVPLEAKATDYY